MADPDFQFKQDRYHRLSKAVYNSFTSEAFEGLSFAVAARLTEQERFIMGHAVLSVMHPENAVAVLASSQEVDMPEIKKGRAMKDARTWAVTASEEAKAAVVASCVDLLPSERLQGLMDHIAEIQAKRAAHEEAKDL